MDICRLKSWVRPVALTALLALGGIVTASLSIRHEPVQAARAVLRLQTSEVQIYPRVQQALAATSKIYVATVKLRGMGLTQTQWIDGRHNIVREEIPLHPGTHHPVFLYIKGAYTIYVRQPNHRAVEKLLPPPSYIIPPKLIAAHEALAWDPATSASGPSEAPAIVTNGKLDGHSVLVLTRQGFDTTGDENIQFRDRLYLNARTLLPMERAYARRQMTRKNTGKISYGHWRTTVTSYSHHLVARSSLPKSWFLPASL
jgi:hypothetical protein